MPDAPSTDGPCGAQEPSSTIQLNAANREPNGRFQKGNKFGKGNPYAHQIAALRSSFLRAVTPADMEEVVASLLNKAKSGDVAAIKLFLSYTLGNQEVAVASLPQTIEPEILRVVFV